MMEKLSLRLRKLFGVLLCSLLFLGGCSPKNSLPDFRDTTFCADLVYITKSTRICVTVQAKEPREASDTLPRDVKLLFSQPEALQGLTITRKDGTITLEYQGIVTNPNYTDLLRPVDLLFGEHHNDTEDQSYEIRLSPNTGFPEEILTPEETLQISNFKKTSSDE